VIKNLSIDKNKWLFMQYLLICYNILENKCLFASTLIKKIFIKFNICYNLTIRGTSSSLIYYISDKLFGHL